MSELECVFCGRSYSFNPFYSFCPDCDEPLLFPIIKKKLKIDPRKGLSLEKFSKFLPLTEIHSGLSLGEGGTPLTRLIRLFPENGSLQVFVKNETLNPTGSFKDRGTAVAVQKAVELGLARIGTVSTGNMASSTAAYGAKAGLKTHVLVKEDISSEKLLSTAAHDPLIVKVKGDYGALFYKSFDLAKKHKIYFMNSVDPLRIEGYKLVGLEIFFQMGQIPPDFVFVPTSSAGHLIGLMKSFIELKQQGRSDRMPIFVGVQAKGCSPLARAFASNRQKFTRLKKVSTIAHAISNPDPPGGNIALKWIREHDGLIIDVTDNEILAAQHLLSTQEGVFCLPSSATTLAGLIKLMNKKILKPDCRSVLVITGTGLKSLKTVRLKKELQKITTLDGLDSCLATCSG